MQNRKGQRRIQVWVNDEEYLWMAKYAGNRRISEVTRDLWAKLRRKIQRYPQKDLYAQK